SARVRVAASREVSPACRTAADAEGLASITASILSGVEPPPSPSGSGSCSRAAASVARCHYRTLGRVRR
ncbi:MAG TPA: hypothetical protein VHG51_05035, partial [Longimicrobiaceae bacterium]|nr:hypothetical protein [Longimicrobiaceae bacterium]